MLFKFGTTREVYESAEQFPERVFTELLTGAVVLDSEYGDDRDYTEVGGYSVVAETAADLNAVNEQLNLSTRPCEWVTRLGKSGFISALYILSNDFSIMLFTPEAIAPPTLLNELE